MLRPQVDTADPVNGLRTPDPLLRGALAPQARTLVDILNGTAAAHPEAPAIDDGRVVLSCTSPSEDGAAN